MAHERGVARGTLLNTLWPQSDTFQASQSLNSLIYSLHKSLGAALGGAPPTLHVDGSYRLNTEVFDELDRQLAAGAFG